MIEIAVESHFEHYSRYNMIVMCGGFDSSATSLFVHSAQKEQGESLTTLTTPQAHHIEVIVYFIPQVVPGSKNSEVADNPPFEATITIHSEKKTIYNTIHSINAWGGAAIKLNLEL